MRFTMRQALVAVFAAVLLAVTATPASASVCRNTNSRLPSRSAADLSDCRAYEMVSPRDKSGFEISTGNAVDSIASGGSVVYASPGAFSGAPSGALPSEYMARRGIDRWLTAPLTPPSDPVPVLFGPDVRGISADFTKVVVKTNAKLTEDATAGDTNLYIHNLTTDAYQLIVDGPPRDEYNFTPRLKGSADLSHVVFSEAFKLSSMPLPPPGSVFSNLYDWSAGQLKLAGVLPDGSAASNGSDAAHRGQGPIYRDVSEDGSRIYFTASENALGFGPIYLRENDSTTTAVTVSQRGAHPEPEPQSGQFWYATPDGSKAYFTSPAQLTNETSVNPGGPFWRDLYQYDAVTGNLSDITPDSNISDSEGASVQGVLGTGSTGPDETYVYFVATGVLAPGATSGQLNLYAWHGGGGVVTTKFIATLDSEEFRGGAFYEESRGRRHSDARISPNGRYLAFTSKVSLAGYENGGTREIYLYSFGTDSLRCASCDPTGVWSEGEAFFEEVLGLNNPQLGLLQNRAVLDDGRLFFNSPDALVPQDDNHHVDAYEYENGMSQLISSGHGDADSFFADASANGTDVFLITRDRLVGQDADGSYDLYDARIDGGLAGQNPVPPAPLCQSDACRPPASAPPPSESIGSASFEGLGNLAPPLIKPKPPASSVRLASALRACRAKHNSHRRLSCESKARKRYGHASTRSSRRAK